MKTKKRRLEQFLFYDFTGIEKHLEKMAAKGWLLNKITPFFWEYQKAEPQKLHYTITYFSEASDFNPHPTKNQQTFYDYCSNAGWQLVTEWAQMQIFCTGAENPVPIETDESVRLRAIHRAMKKNFIPSSILMLLMSVLQLALQVYTIFANPTYVLSSNTVLFTAAMWNILAVCVLVNLFGYIAWYQKSKKLVAMGGVFIQSSCTPQRISLVLAVLSIVLAAFFIFSQRFGWLGVLGLLNVAIICTGVFLIKNTLKRHNVSRRLNFVVTMLACVVLSFALTGALAWGIFRGVDAGLFHEEPYDTYTTVMPNGSSYSWEIYHDTLPLRVEDLEQVDYEHYSYEWEAETSLLLNRYEARQNAFPDGHHAPQLQYEILEVKWLPLYSLCLSDYLNKYDYDQDIPREDRMHFKRTNDPAWQADAVYQLTYGQEQMSEYVLCWGSRIVFINYDKMPTPEQIATTIKKLR